MSTHKKYHCSVHTVRGDPEKAQLRERVAEQAAQLAAKDRQIAERDEQAKRQLAAKDRQIDQLLRMAKRPRTVNNTQNISNHVNVFGKESLAHITDAKLQELLRDRV